MQESTRVSQLQQKACIPSRAPKIQFWMGLNLCTLNGLLFNNHKGLEGNPPSGTGTLIGPTTFLLGLEGVLETHRSNNKLYQVSART